MEKITKGHPLTQSPDFIKQNIETIKSFFPTIVKEGKIDFEELKALLVDDLETEEEFYRFTWAGKSMARREATKPSAATLLPCKEESKNWETTQNIFIEGDNLEVLKLLQKSYSNKIKMIYIDPPYNTGKDFVYKDNYSDNLNNYLELTGQLDEAGRKFSTNTESDGRYHSNWLNMMYPRLILARNLLTDDGMIFISIDDGEISNLKKILDEIFGEENFVNCISVNLKNIAGASGGGEDKRLKKNVEFILIYCRNYSELKRFENVYEFIPVHELVEAYKKEGKSWKYTSVLIDRGEKNYIGSTLDGDGNEIKIFRRDNHIIKSVNQLVNEENLSEEEIYKKYAVNIFQTAMPQSSIRPRVMKKVKEIGELVDLYSIEYTPKSGKNKDMIYEQFYKGENFRLLAWLSDVSQEIDGVLCKKEMKGTYWDYVGETKNLTKEGGVSFLNGKKPLKMLQRIISMSKETDVIILDFFAGSSTTAHAVMQQNYEDEGNRRFIMVQLPEPIEDIDPDNKQVFRNIAELSKERIRIAGEKILYEKREELKQLIIKVEGTILQDDIKQQIKILEKAIEEFDIGFKVLKLGSSNIIAWDGDPEKLEQTLFNAESNIKKNRTEDDILYEILLKYGLDLAQPIEQKIISGKSVFNIGCGVLFICLADGTTTNVAEGIGKWKEELNPATCKVIFKDTGFTDVEKTNSMQILKRYGIEEVNTI
jgi:adenine-specific DNA-methyltransferase